MTLSVVRCPLCGHRVAIRVKGTLVTHYKTGRAVQGNQCPASRRTPAEAEAMSQPVAAPAFVEEEGYAVG